MNFKIKKQKIAYLLGAESGKITLEVILTSEVEFVHIYSQRKLLIWLIFFWTWDRMLNPNSFEGKLLSVVHEPLEGTDCTTCQHLKGCQTFNRHPTTDWVNEKKVKCYLCNRYYQFLGTTQNIVPSFFPFFFFSFLPFFPFSFLSFLFLALCLAFMLETGSYCIEKTSIKFVILLSQIHQMLWSWVYVTTPFWDHVNNGSRKQKRL